MATLWKTKADIFVNSLGVPRAGGKVTFFAAGTSTPQFAYSEDALSSSFTSLTLDAVGRPQVNVYLDDLEYKIVVTNSDLTDSKTIDIVHGGLPGDFDASDMPVIATGGSTARVLSDRFGDAVNVKDYGAGSDDATIDTAAFLAAAATGRPIFAPYAVYKLVAGNLKLGAAQPLYGDGMDSAVIKSFSTTGAIVTIGGTASLVSYSGIKDIKIGFDASVANQSGQRTVRVSNAAYFSLDHVDMQYGLINFQAEDCLIYEVTKCLMRNGTIGVNLVPSATYYPAHNQATYASNKITSNLNQAIVAEGTGNNTFHQLVFEKNNIEGNGTDASGLNVCNFTNVGKTGIGPGVTFRNNWFESNHGLRDLSLTGQNTSCTFEVSGNSFFSTAVTTDNLAVSTGVIAGSANGMIATGPTNNVSFAADVSGIFLANKIARLNDLSAGLVVTNVPQWTARASANSVAISGSSVAGSHTYSSQLTKKSKNGTKARYDFIMVITGLGTISGNIRLTGLETSVNDGVLAGGGILTQFQGVNLPAGATQITLEVGNNVTYADLIYNGDAINAGFVTEAMLTATVTLRGFVEYHTAS